MLLKLSRSSVANDRHPNFPEARGPPAGSVVLLITLLAPGCCVANLDASRKPQHCGVMVTRFSDLGISHPVDPEPSRKIMESFPNQGTPQSQLQKQETHITGNRPYLGKNK